MDENDEKKKEKMEKEKKEKEEKEKEKRNCKKLLQYKEEFNLIIKKAKE